MVIWTDTTRLQLLWAVIEVGEQPGKWNLIAQNMGPEFTSESVRGVYKKMKKERDEHVANGAGSSTGASAPATPSSRKRKGDATPATASKKTKTKKTEEEVKAELAEDVKEETVED